MFKATLYENTIYISQSLFVHISELNTSQIKFHGKRDYVRYRFNMREHYLS